MKYTVYVKSANCASTEIQYWERNCNYFKTRAYSSVDNGFRSRDDLCEPYRIPNIYKMTSAVWENGLNNSGRQTDIQYTVRYWNAGSYDGKINLKIICTISPYRSVNTVRLGYINQPVNAVQWNNRCLFSDPQKTHKHTVLAERRM